MGTNIDEFIEDLNSNNLSNEENSMINSIINDLNHETNSGNRGHQQQQMQQQQQQQQQQHPPPSVIKKPKSENFEDLTIKSVLNKTKNSLVVFFLLIFFNLNPIDDIIRFKSFSFFYDVQTDKSTFAFVFFKAIFVSTLYYLITYLIK